MLSILSALVPAISIAFAGYILARHKSSAERALWLKQARDLAPDEVTILREAYINPLRYWGFLLMKRVRELGCRLQSGEYDPVRASFQRITDHATGTRAIGDFPFWSAYDGVFAMTTLYWTCKYLWAAREICLGAPFKAVDPPFRNKLQLCLTHVSEAFGGIPGSTLEIIAELPGTESRSWGYEHFCRLVDSGDKFKVVALLRLLDYYIHEVTAEKCREIGAALEELVRFLDSKSAHRPVNSQLELAAAVR